MQKKNAIVLIDSTLRDGNHAVSHALREKQIATYARVADRAGIPVVIVGHGNGLGASSLQVGKSLLSDQKMLTIARKQMNQSKLGVYVIPGFATIQKDLAPAITIGVDIFCIGSHCTEADTTQKHIEYVVKKGKIAYGNLMMSHTVSARKLAEECKKMESYGASGIILMDSAGNYLPNDVQEKISKLIKSVNIPIGFHAHNNLELAVANSLVAVENGATIIDGCAAGFGAGAGNAALEVIVAILGKMGYETGVDLYQILDAADIAHTLLMRSPQVTKPISIVSGLAGVFSGFAKHVIRVAKQYSVDPRDMFFELGKRKVVAGQEDIIVQVAIDLHDSKKLPTTKT